MVETGATGRPFPGWEDVAEDIVPAADDTYDLGSATKKWAAAFIILLAIATSITIGGVVKIYTTGTTLMINDSTQIEGNLDVDGWITSSNWTNVSITESQISDLQSYLTSYTETDPLWTGNSTLVPYLASVNVFTANQNLTTKNISAIDCIIFDSGGKICSGV